jgi:hypothetical protein
MYSFVNCQLPNATYIYIAHLGYYITSKCRRIIRTTGDMKGAMRDLIETVSSGH